MAYKVKTHYSSFLYQMLKSHLPIIIVSDGVTRRQFTASYQQFIAVCLLERFQESCVSVKARL